MINSGVEATSQYWEDNKDKWGLNRLLENSDITLERHWKEHLFIPAAWDGSALAKRRQKDFINGSSLLPALNRTLKGYLGVVFRKPTEIELATGLDYLLDNCDGDGTSLEQFIQDVTAEDLLQGYGGILVDFANNDGLNSKAQDAKLNKQATMHIYQAECIKNIYTIKVGAVTVVQQIVLEESYQDRIDQFVTETKKQYRVLLLNEAGKYIQQTYRLTEEGTAMGLYEQFEPRNSKGQQLDYIPFSFFGAESNTFYPTGSPLYDLSRLNAKHLEYSAMRNESIRQLAPTLFAFPGEGFDYEAFEDSNPQGITMGGYNAYMLGSGGSASIIQASANDAAVEEMKHLEEQMIQAGAMLVTPQSSNVSTDTTMVHKNTETSVLGMIVRNVENSINKALTWCADFMGTSDESTIDINREFFAAPMTAQDRAQWASDVMAGFVTIDEYRTALVKSEMLPESAMDEEVIVEMDEEPLEEDDDNE